MIYGTVGADIDLSGSGRVRFQRDMGANNAVGPGVAVIWNPNLLLNWPEQLSDALTDWPASPGFESFQSGVRRASGPPKAGKEVAP